MTDGSDGEQSQQALLEELQALRSEVQALRKDVRTDRSQPEPEDAREAQQQAEERGDLNAASKAKAERALEDAESPPNGNNPTGWL